MSLINNIIVKTVQLMPKSFVKIFANKYIAGETIEETIELTKKLNSQGIFGTIDLLGEAITTKQQAIDSKNECLRILEEINNNNLKANLSIKPTQMGLLIDEEFCFQNIRELVNKAKELNNFVRLDMEDSSTTDGIIRVYKRLIQDFPGNVGIVLQAYLKRTENDAEDLIKLNTNFRLCKGIYIESPSIAFKEKTKINDNFMKVLEIMLSNGSYVGIATHDEYLINKSYELVKKLNLSNDKYEFQMLLGVREDLREKIVKDGYKIRIYIPYGKDWYLYSIRRLKENPDIARQIFNNLFKIK